jgi:hypothetical protein
MDSSINIVTGIQDGQLSQYSDWHTGYTTVESLFGSRQAKKFSPKLPDRLLDTLGLLFSGYRRGIKRPVREADPTPPSIAVDKNEWSYSSIPHMSS